MCALSMIEKTSELTTKWNYIKVNIRRLQQGQ